MVSLVHQGDIQVYFDKVVPSNLGALLHPENPVVRALCNSLDIFSIWALVTLTIGFRTVTTLSTGMTASITFLPCLPTTSTDKVDYQGLKGMAVETS